MSSSSLLPSKRSHEDVSSAEKSRSQQPPTQKQKELTFKEKKEKLLYGSGRWYPLTRCIEPMEPKERKKMKCRVCLKEDDHYTCACKWFNRCTSLDKVGPGAELICICCGDDAYNYPTV